MAMGFFPGIPTIGIRFDIDKTDKAAYGDYFWQIFWRAVDPADLSGALFYDGDTAATGAGSEMVYCIAVQHTEADVVDRVKEALSRSEDFKKVCANPMFIEGSKCMAEPLPSSGKINNEGNLIEASGPARGALGTVKRERRQLQQGDQPEISGPERKKPASNRTANLPAVSSIKELLAFFFANFGEAEGFAFWVTPEELCDIVEQYADILQVQYSEDSCQMSEDMTYVTLLNKGQIGENISLYGLFPFANEEEAKRHCKNEKRDYPRDLIGQLEGLWGIQGKFAVNFSGSRGNWIHEGFYKKERDIEAFALWPRIFKRYKYLGIKR
jgi:hypothetical protein